MDVYDDDVDSDLARDTAWAESSDEAASPPAAAACADDGTSTLCQRLEDIPSGSEPAPWLTQPQGDSTAQHLIARRSPNIGSSLLSLLPEELLIRLLGFVPATDLATLAATCNWLRRYANLDSLWRRLHHSRWAGRTTTSGSTSWKARYIEADAAECDATLRHLSGQMLAVFTQMQRAKRSRCLPVKEAGEVLAQEDCHLSAQVAEWRRSRGFQASSPMLRPAFPHGVCAPTFTRIAQDVYGSDDTGWLHICDDSCTELVPDDADSLVCRISGRTRERMMSEVEIRATAAADKKRRGEEGVEPDYEGRLARAYMAGYHARSEREIERLFGRRL